MKKIEKLEKVNNDQSYVNRKILKYLLLIPRRIFKQLQLWSEYRTRLVFEWLEQVWLPNVQYSWDRCSDKKQCKQSKYLNTRQKSVQSWMASEYRAHKSRVLNLTNTFLHQHYILFLCLMFQLFRSILYLLLGNCHKFKLYFVNPS